MKKALRCDYCGDVINWDPVVSDGCVYCEYDCFHDHLTEPFSWMDYDGAKEQGEVA